MVMLPVGLICTMHGSTSLVTFFPQVVWRLPQDNGLLIDWMEVHWLYKNLLFTSFHVALFITNLLLVFTSFQVQWQPMRRGDETWVPSGERREMVQRRRGSVSVVIRYSTVQTNCNHIFHCSSQVIVAIDSLLDWVESSQRAGSIRSGNHACQDQSCRS